MDQKKSIYDKLASFTPKKLQMSLTALEMNPQVGEIIVELLARERSFFSEIIPRTKRSPQQQKTLSLFSTDTFEGYVVMVSSLEDENVAHPLFIIGEFDDYFAVRTLETDSSFYKDFINVLRVNSTFHVNLTNESMVTSSVVEMKLSELDYKRNLHAIHQDFDALF